MMKKDRQFKVFIDFDGTITKKDVGAHLFLEFGDKAKVDNVLKDIIEGRVQGKDIWIDLLKTLHTIDLKEFIAFAKLIEIDQSFHELIRFLDRPDCEVFVVSDGMDFYIREIFQRENLLGLNWYANEFYINEHNKPYMVFPYTDEECKLCGNCKRNIVISNSADEDFTFYIGNGHSDTCAAQFCDYVFAKDDLLKYCEKNNVTFFPYDSFSDVQERLDKLFRRKYLKKRHQAELKRRSVYMQG